ncbi:hypothetical protein D9756_009860 [Leucocoprinus leucothites]|uniref:Uncharacterized protein n=1 Tax=Leucocoprinus leucothites TaxID=201217 RepID=A0A8H5FTQ0_9AGAR|nr:hypothetical protein D9756_011214 [Leucoagaricus leucothites]KAF5348821.1 hypothetical protein D9756_009860 [Leucoagaricus leucothites]
MSGLLAYNIEPLDALYRHFNVVKAGYHAGPIEERFVMTLTTLNASRYPSHCLAVTQTNSPANSPALMLPVCKDLYRRGFDPNLRWPKEDEPPEISDETEDATDLPVTIPPLSDDPIKISLPVHPITVPHLVSLPLVLLFGLGLETDIERLPYRLLPSSVVAEFPAAPAMAEIFAKFPEQQFERYHMYLKGFWGNILSLGLKHKRIMEIVSTAWSVASEARRIRQRQQSGLVPQRR